MKIRFIEPGNRPYKPTPLNYFVYDRYIRTPSVGLNTLATIVKEKVPDTLMYSEAISRLVMEDLVDADIIFIGIFTFNAVRGYKLARYFQKKSNAVIVMGGLHASMNYKEAVKYCDYVLLGEGDESIIEMVEAVKRKETPTFPGVAYRKDGRIFTLESGSRRHILRRYQTKIWSIIIRKWRDTTRSGGRCMPPEAVPTTVITARWCVISGGVSGRGHPIMCWRISARQLRFRRKGITGY